MWRFNPSFRWHGVLRGHLPRWLGVWRSSARGLGFLIVICYWPWGRSRSSAYCLGFPELVCMALGHSGRGLPGGQGFPMIVCQLTVGFSMLSANCLGFPRLVCHAGGQIEGSSSACQMPQGWVLKTALKSEGFCRHRLQP